MINNKDICDFSNKWRTKFLDRNTNYIELIEIDFGNDCKALGFEMDCGKNFISKYGKDAFNDCEKLETIINNINDIYLLGSAIHSKWRYFNHWAYSGSEILEPKNRKWFVLILDRLIELTIEETKGKSYEK